MMSGRTVHALGLAAAFGLIFLLNLGPASGRASLSPYSGFPLWKDVPGRSFAVLGEGQLRKGTRWGVYASRVGGGKRGRNNPCISVARITRDGIYGHANRCGPLAPKG